MCFLYQVTEMEAPPVPRKPRSPAHGSLGPLGLWTPARGQAMGHSRDPSQKSLFVSLSRSQLDCLPRLSPSQRRWLGPGLAWGGEEESGASAWLSSVYLP